MPSTSRPDDAGHLPCHQATVGCSRRWHPSRLPWLAALLGFVLGTLVVDLMVISVRGDSPLSGTWANVVDPAAWWSALVALGEPALALASAAVGGLSGALGGHRLALRRLRRDRLDALLRDGRLS